MTFFMSVMRPLCVRPLLNYKRLKSDDPKVAATGK